MKKKEKDLDFNEIDERLAAGWYLHSGQRKRYLKSIIKDKKELIFLVLKRWLMSMLNFQII